jgi:hypothetical protein
MVSPTTAEVTYFAAHIVCFLMIEEIDRMDVLYVVDRQRKLYYKQSTRTIILLTYLRSMDYAR